MPLLVGDLLDKRLRPLVAAVLWLGEMFVAQRAGVGAKLVAKVARRRVKVRPRRSLGHAELPNRLPRGAFRDHARP